jgi:ABC-type sugar transport system permease subunit
LRAFDLVFVTTRGGPAPADACFQLIFYFNAFQINRVGYAAAIAFVQTMILLGLSFLLLSSYIGEKIRTEMPSMKPRCSVQQW